MTVADSDGRPLLRTDLLILLYFVYDLQLAAEPPRWQRALQAFFMPARWVGMNTIFIYLMAPSAEVFGNMQNWLYFGGDTDNNLRDLIHDYAFCGQTHDRGVGPHSELYCGAGIFNGHPEKWAQLAWTVARIAFWSCVAGELHRRRWYWAL